MSQHGNNPSRVFYNIIILYRRTDNMPFEYIILNMPKQENRIKTVRTWFLIIPSTYNKTIIYKQVITY